jgi:hypothetical protein
MPKALDLTNRRFERLVVVERAENDIRGRSRWKIRCDCGGEKTVTARNLCNGSTKSCGCLHQDRTREQAIRLFTKHGHSRGRSGTDRSPEYHTWTNMLTRCTNPKTANYLNYGALGVTVCDRWQGKDGFANFLLDMGERPNGTSLSRFADIGNYEPGNVAWHTPKEQAAEQRKKRLLMLKAVPKEKIAAIYSSDALQTSQFNENHVSI